MGIRRPQTSLWRPIIPDSLIRTQKCRLRSSTTRPARPGHTPACCSEDCVAGAGDLQAVAELGGSASISEIVEAVIKREGFSDAQQAALHNDGPEIEIGYRLAWSVGIVRGCARHHRTCDPVTSQIGQRFAAYLSMAARAASLVSAALAVASSA